MPLQETSGTASYDGFGGGVAAVPVYIEEIFQSYLYTGNGSTQTITNNIDLSTKGGLVWCKDRDAANSNTLYDTARGVRKTLYSNTTGAQVTEATNEGVYAFGTTGFSIGGGSNTSNGSGNNIASWTFRKQPKFFDVVTYTGTGSSRTVSHNLGSTPGCIIVKRTDSTGQWGVWNRNLTNNNYVLLLNSTIGETNDSTFFGGAPTSTTFTVDSNTSTNASGGTYVAYLFAHNAGGFGLTGTDNVISCGSFVGASGSVTLGYEPQWVLFKKTSALSNWELCDVMRGSNQTDSARLYPNVADAEAPVGAQYIIPTATGFDYANQSAGANYIYIAIRRGPMKVPTSGTSVFTPIAWSGTGSSTTVTGSGFAADAAMIMVRNGADDKKFAPRLTGQNHLTTDTTNAEITSDLASNPWDSMNGINVGSTGGANQAGKTYIYEFFKRAPSFMDVVCYTGTGSARTVTHNLGVVPELIIVKGRSLAGYSWFVYDAASGNTKASLLNTTGIPTAYAPPAWNNTSPTSSVFSVGTGSGVNNSGDTYVAYLFATCAGVSKVGSYTGNGSSQTINCGFTAGARFVMIKRTNSTGDWYVWDTARGIVASTDPHLSLNTTVAEVTTDDTIDTDNTGFIVNQLTATNVNVSSATYIFLAIA